MSTENPEISVAEAQEQLPELVERVCNGEFIYLTRSGKRVAALMPADVAENYECIEDDYWARRAQQARHSEYEFRSWNGLET